MTASWHSLVADRGAELALYDRMVAGETAARILLIEAASGIGKSHLLREYERRTPRNVLCVPLDLKTSPDLAEVFSLLIRGLGAVGFPSFRQLLQQLLQPQQVNVARNVLIGQPQIAVALQAPDAEAQRFRRTALTETFFADLLASGWRIVFLIDTLNNATPEVRDWLLNPFLGHVRAAPNVVAVLAGQPPLETLTTWAACCEHIRLRPISSAQDWQHGLQQLDPSLSIPLEMIEAYCVYFDGHPLQIAIALDKLIAVRGGVR